MQYTSLRMADRQKFGSQRSMRDLLARRHSPDDRLMILGFGGPLPGLPEATTPRALRTSGSSRNSSRVPRIMPRQRESFRVHRPRTTGRRRAKLHPIEKPVTRVVTPIVAAAAEPELEPEPEPEPTPAPEPETPPAPPEPAVEPPDPGLSRWGRFPTGPYKPLNFADLPWRVICRIMLFLREGNALRLGGVCTTWNSVVTSTTFWALTVERLEDEVRQLWEYRDLLARAVADLQATIDLWPEDPVTLRAVRRSALPPPLEYCLSAVGCIMRGLWQTLRRRRREARRRARAAAAEAARLAELARWQAMSESEQLLEVLAKKDREENAAVVLAVRKTEWEQERAAKKAKRAAEAAAAEAAAAAAEGKERALVARRMARAKELAERAAEKERELAAMRGKAGSCSGSGGGGAAGGEGEGEGGKNAIDALESVLGLPEPLETKAATKTAATEEVVDKVQAPQGRARRALFEYYLKAVMRRADYAGVSDGLMALASKVVKRGEQLLARASEADRPEWQAMYDPFYGMPLFMRALVKLTELGKTVAHLEIGSLTVEGVDRAIRLRQRKIILANTMVKNER